LAAVNNSLGVANTYNSHLKHVGREGDGDGKAMATANKLVEPNDCRRKPVGYYPSYENNTIKGVVNSLNHLNHI
jgi:hypothetical protein